jgi:DNA-directed RNA polymerase specialized sigma24 family protein
MWNCWKSSRAATRKPLRRYSVSDIAEALGISVGTVKSRVFRAVRLPRGDLQRMGVEP